MAKSIEWAATPAGTHGQGQGQLEATQEGDAELVAERL